MNRNRHEAEILEQQRKPGDVVDVGVSEQDRFDVRAALLDEIDHQLRLEVRVDDHRIVRVLVLDQERVRSELPVDGVVDAQPHYRVLRTTK